MATTALTTRTLTPRFDLYRGALFLLIIVAVGKSHLHFPIMVQLRPALVLTGLTMAYAMMNPSGLADRSVLKLWPAKLIAALGIWSVASIPLSISIGGTAMFVFTEYSKTIVMALLLILAVRDTRDLLTLLWGFVAAVGSLAILSILVFKVTQHGDDEIARIQNGYAYDSNDIGLVAVVGIAITLLLFQSSKGVGKLFSMATLAALGATIARTGSRGAFVGLVCVGGGLLVLLREVPIAKRMAFVVLCLVGVGVAAPSGYWEQMQTILAPSEDYNWDATQGRMELIKRAFGYMMRNPATGLGAGQFGRAEGTMSPLATAHSADPGSAGVKWSAAHNSFMQIGAEMGVPGLVLFSMLVFGCILEGLRLQRVLPPAWRKSDPERRLLFYCATYLPVAFLGFASAGFFVSFAYLDVIYVLTAFHLGMLRCIQMKQAEELGGGTAVPVPVAATRRGRGGGWGPAVPAPWPAPPPIPPARPLAPELRERSR